MMTTNRTTLIITAGLCLALGISSCQQHTANTVTKKPAADSVTKPAVVPTHLLGMWLDEEIKLEGKKVAYQIVTQGKKNYIQVVTFTGKKLYVDDSPAISPSASELKLSNNKYICIDRPNEIYMIQKSGELSIYNENGLVVTCKRLL